MTQVDVKYMSASFKISYTSLRLSWTD